MGDRAHPSKRAALREMFFREVKRDPGHHLRHYADQLDMDYKKLGPAAANLHVRGLIRIEDAGRGRRPKYYPVSVDEFSEISGFS